MAKRGFNVMHFSAHTLHPPVVTLDEHKNLVRQKMLALAARRPAPSLWPALAPPSITIPLTTVAQSGNFDAYIQVQFPTGATPATAPLIVDSGNSCLIIPNGEDLVGVAGYNVLGTATEPWGCPANVVQGPIQILSVTGAIYEIPNCIFYACTGPNSDGERTANFGLGCVMPWSANSWSTPPGIGVTLQSPLSYNTAYPYVEIVYAPAKTVFSASAVPNVNDESTLILNTAQPGGYTMMSIVPNYEWMSVIPTSLSVAGTATGWPGSAATAFVDTGGGPVFLSDPNGYVYKTKWPTPVSCPLWSNGSLNCTCVSDQLQIVLRPSGGGPSYGYIIETKLLPPSVQGLTGVFCQNNKYMMDQYGMNIGGVSALFNRIVIDYAGSRVGLAPMK